LKSQTRAPYSSKLYIEYGNENTKEPPPKQTYAMITTPISYNNLYYFPPI